MSLTIDSREFQAAMKAYMAESSKDAAFVLNKKSFYIAKAASKTTFKADSNAIKMALGAIATRFRVVSRGRNKGKVRAGRSIVGSDSLAERIIRARMAASGQSQPTQAEGKSLAEKLISKRASAAGFMRSGWLASLAGFAGAIGIPTTAKSLSPFKKRQPNTMGGALPAKPSFRPEASFWNTAESKTNDNPIIEGYAEQGLKIAIAQEIASIEKWLADKLQSSADKHIAR